jgi:electron transfer flavoprotein alpha subunit
MSYALVIGETRKGVLQEGTFDPLYLCTAIGLSASVLLPEGDYPSLKGVCEKIIPTSLQEGDFLNPLNLSSLVKSVCDSFGDASLVLFPHSFFGMSAAPYLAGQLGWPVITDISGYAEAEDKRQFIKSLYSEKIHGYFCTGENGRMVGTVRKGAFPHPEELTGETVVESALSVEIDTRRTFLEYAEKLDEDVDISRADILVSVGRGLQEEENIPPFEELASLLGAVLSCSRPVVDKGWLPTTRQVGTSGKTVKPKVYLAFGIAHIWNDGF